MSEFSPSQAIQNENINQNSSSPSPQPDIKNIKSIQSDIERNTLPDSSEKKVQNSILHQNNLNNFIKKEYKNDINDMDNDNIDEINKEKIRLQNIEKKENYEKLESLFLSKKRLMKKNDIILKNKLLKKLAKNYIDKEAELGSDNEEHDDVVKKVYHSDSDSEKENDRNAQDIENLINNEEDDNLSQNEKYFNDMLEKDHEEILKVIEGPKKRIIKEQPKKIMIDDNGLSLKVRMDRMSDLNNLR